MTGHDSNYKPHVSDIADRFHTHEASQNRRAIGLGWTENHIFVYVDETDPTRAVGYLSPNGTPRRAYVHTDGVVWLDGTAAVARFSGLECIVTTPDSFILKRLQDAYK